ncbi:fimbria/pilus chaperone family protein [Yersinia massiliensis]|uniref:fimbria/pilus chaperone family protein n=1 Tax=Yersinia massiliensis TaxID=419257 RepID=UPI001CFDE2D5|nr:fimbria/pilus chaperone family protein [Yersinia massiliensis]MCB5309659.1 fimbria/pilus periplasmic chaperone [Yersinia massiliensis]
MPIYTKTTAAIFFSLNSFLISNSVLATGVIPETTVLLVKESEGSATMNVTNSDAVPTILTTSIESIPEDKEPLLVTTNPLSFVDAGGKQMVRFVLTNKKPLTVQRLVRVNFVGVPGRNKGEAKKNSIGMNVGQNIPAIIHPAGLKEEKAPWEKLSWSIKGDQLTVSNDSPYIVRMSQKIDLLPQGGLASLPKTYILPGEKFILNITSKEKSQSLTYQNLRIYPATVYGFMVNHYDVKL